MRIFILANLLFFTTSFNLKFISERLCKDNEEIVFSLIVTKTKKIASLCKDKEGKYLVYRFGTKNNLELEYPVKLDKSSWEAFQFSGQERGGGKANAGFGEYSLSFTNKGVAYKMFQSWSDEFNTTDVGIIVKDGNKEITLKCDKKSQQGSLVRLNNEHDKIKNTLKDE